MFRRLLGMWPAIMVCGGAWFFGGLMIYLAITEGPNTMLLLAGVITAFVPAVFILSMLIFSGTLKPGHIGLVEIAMGLVACGFGMLFIYGIGGSFSPVKAVEAGGFMAVLPLIFLAAGLFMIIRGFMPKK